MSKILQRYIFLEIMGFNFARVGTWVFERGCSVSILIFMFAVRRYSSQCINR